MARDQLVPLPWPIGGFVENTSQQGQAQEAPGTTTDALNVRTRDSLDRRKRGGQRSGLELYLADAVNGSNSIQALSQSILAFDSKTVIADTVLQPEVANPTFTDTFTYTDGLLETVSSPKWTSYENSAAGNINRVLDTAANDIQAISVDDGDATVILGVIGGTADYRGSALTTAPSIGTAYVQTYEVELPTTGASTQSEVLMCWRAGTLGGGSGVDMYSFALERVGGAGSVNITYAYRTHEIGVGAPTLDSGTIVSTSDAVYTATVEIIVNGDTLTVKVNSVTILDAVTMAKFSGNTNIAFAMTNEAASGALVTPRIASMTVATGLLPASRRTTKLITVSGGSVYSGNKDGVNIAGSGSAIFGANNDVVLQPAFQKVYMSDGLIYRILDARTNVVSNWQTSLQGGALPVGGNGTTYAITAVTPGTPSFTVAEDLSTVLSAGDFIEIRDSTSDSTNLDRDNNQTFTVASTSGTGPTVVTTDQAIQSSVADGVLVKGNVTCRILALYRGRLVLTGLETDPHNIFMLEVANPLNANYFPTTTSATQPVAANITRVFGTIGDVVTAWATYTDDMAIIGMANSLAVLRGDPAAGGVIDNISDKIGIVGPEAWTFDTGGRFYFMGVNGLYRMDLGSFQPILISQNKLDKTFTDINTATKRVQLVYDPKWQGVHILIKSQVQQTVTADTHYFYSEEDEAFWPDQYPLAHGPLSAYRFTSDDPSENAVLFGGWDSKIRAFGDTATTDDGTLINSFCRFSPITPGDIVATSRIHDVVVVMDDQSNDVQFKIFAGGTVEAAEAAADAGTPRIAKTLTGGRNGSIRQRIAQNTIIVELSQNGVDSAGATWAFEKAMARVAVGGRIHGRGV